MICWIIPIIVGLLCALLGYLLGRMCCNRKLKECERNLSDTQNRLKNHKKSFEKQSFTQSPPPKKTIAPLVFDRGAAEAIFGKTIKADDLTIVEGIGPKIKELFHNEGIKTWRELSQTTVERCQEILDDAGDRYKIHNPGTWPRQAELAFEGRWEDLLKWQDGLKGGVE